MLIGSVLNGAALAQAPRKPAPAVTARDVLGVWSFRTSVYRQSCVLSGRMVIRAGANARDFLCSFEAIETCSDIRLETEQTCEASFDDGQLTIDSEVGALTFPKEGYDLENYWPDNFDLAVESANRMTGILRSFASAPVVFERGTGAIS
ncbi:MAG TPA: hypothetical protein DCZ49_07530 [Hyphomonadaceae bacterium]|nr:hypothetical protein [Hyphomonadaceae bacterium]